MTTVAELLARVGLESHPRGAQDVGREIDGPATLDRATQRQLAFVTAALPDGAGRLARSQAALVICAHETLAALDSDTAGSIAPVLAASGNPRLDFVRSLDAFFAAPAPQTGVDPSAHVADGASIDPSATVGPLCSVGPEATVGAECRLGPGVHLRGPVRLGARVVVGAGTVLGEPGFGFERTADGTLVRFVHLGGVVVEDDVEIGANSCVDRGALEDTWIGAGSKIDNLVHIAHNARIGPHATVIARAMIAGGCHVGARAWIAPSASLREGVRIGDDATVGLGAVVMADVPDGAVVVGVPARPLDEHRRMLRRLREL
jgi:UDP-3-O-[3-hydroxymyristoyl] glucosamine N-acyltransferase